jgi:hypothetical protein
MGDKGGREAKFLGGPEAFGAENERKYSVSGYSFNVMNNEN